MVNFLFHKRPLHLVENKAEIFSIQNIVFMRPMTTQPKNKCHSVNSLEYMHFTCVFTWLFFSSNSSWFTHMFESSEYNWSYNLKVDNAYNKNYNNNNKSYQNMILANCRLMPQSSLPYKFNGPWKQIALKELQYIIKSMVQLSEAQKPWVVWMATQNSI